MPRHKIYASGKIVTRIHVYFVTLQIIHWFLLRSCPGHLCLAMPGQDRNKNQCVFCNVILGQVTLSPTGSHRLHWPWPSCCSSYDCVSEDTPQLLVSCSYQSGSFLPFPLDRLFQGLVTDHQKSMRKGMRDLNVSKSAANSLSNWF